MPNFAAFQIKNDYVMKNLIILLTVLLVMSSCGTYTGQGAYVGGSFGSIVGSAIGGISGGWRGRDVGTLIGMAGGAAVGAAIGAAADQKQAEKMEQYRREREQRQARYEEPETSGVYDDSGFDATNSADDRIDFDGAGPRAEIPAADNAKLEIRGIRIVDGDHDGILRAGEECQISFEVMNRSARPVYDVQPLVTEVTGNKRIYISPNLHVESIAPHSGIRYTATLLADKKLKDGTAVIRVGVAQGNQKTPSQMQDITIKTSRK